MQKNIERFTCKAYVLIVQTENRSEIFFDPVVTSVKNSTRWTLF